MGELYLKLNQFGSNETQMLELKHSLKAYMESKKLRHILYQKNHIFYRLEYINVLKNLANTYGRMKNYKMAVKELTEAEEICVKAYQKTPNYIADLYTTVLNNLADMYAATECFSVAISIYEKALSICLEYGLSDTPIVSQSLELTKSVFEYSSSCGIIGRNDLCPCRSGKKYKKCCGKN